MSEHRIILGRDLLEAIAPAIGVEFNNLRRAILDIRFDDVVIVYIEELGDDRLFHIDWPGQLKDTKIVRAEPK